MDSWAKSILGEGAVKVKVLWSKHAGDWSRGDGRRGWRARRGAGEGQSAGGREGGTRC